MPTNNYSKNIVYLSKEQYQELITNETLTVNGQTITYNENDIYVTPQAEPITDVKINGTSIGSNGIANIPLASSYMPGIMKVSGSYGHQLSSGVLVHKKAITSTLQRGVDNFDPVVAANQHESIFFGLSKLAGVDLANETVTLGTYPATSKAAIQNMLGITDLLSTEESSTATAAHTLNSTFMMDGKLHRATAAIAVGDAVTEGENCEVVKVDEVFVKKTDIATNTTAGLIKVSSTYGLRLSSGTIVINETSSNTIKSGTWPYAAISPEKQHESVFYGLSKVAGVDLKNEEVTLGTYPETSKTAIRALIGAAAASSAITDVQINGTSVISSNVANIPIADSSNLGVVKINAATGIDIVNGFIRVNAADSDTIKYGTNTLLPIVVSHQHEATFYGLAKVAGDNTQVSSGNTVGTYTETAKSAIRTMIGAASPNVIAVQDEQPTAADTKVWLPETEQQGIQVPTMDDMNSALATKVGDVQVNGSSVVSNGVANIPMASNSVPGVVRVNDDGTYGIRMLNGQLAIKTPASTAIKNGNSGNQPLTPLNQHEATFYGLAKAAGDTTQSISTNAVGTYTSDASAAIRNMLGTVGFTDYANTTTAGVIKMDNGGNTGLQISNGILKTDCAGFAHIKVGTNIYMPINPAHQHEATFYGLAKAAGDTTQSASSNAVGTYTTEAKAAIQTMLGIDLQSIAAQVDIPLVETVEGTTPSITGQPNVRYVCGEVSTLSITPPASGSMDVIFESGSTAAVLTVPNIVKWPVWFDATTLETDTTYEILITDGVYGSVMTWAT